MSHSNGARLSRLIIDVGTVTMRKYFDSIHPPGTLTDDLYAKYRTLRANIPRYQMRTLFPPTGVLPAMKSTSKDYDITILFSLLRNICGLNPPASIHGGTSWDENPPLTDVSQEADLVRIKYYRNELAHMITTDVSDDDFNIYWSDISRALERLNDTLGEDIRDQITYLRICSLEGTDWTRLLLDLFRNDPRIGNLVRECQQQTETIKNYSKCILCGVIIILVLLIAIVVLGFYFHRGSLREPDYSYPQNFSNPGFVGREWVFRQMEADALGTSGARGVLLVADPGWGKSAIMKHLISSSSSSAVIHENVIGYHFCKYNEKSTRDGGRFVKNLVQLIGKKIPEYRKIVNKDQLVQDILKSNCNDNPVKCFQAAIVEPLQNLDSIGRNKSFFLIDALDECLEEVKRFQSIIVTILRTNVPDLPDWVKVIITSRNQTVATGKMSNIGLSTIKIDVDDEQNEKDLRTYAAHTVESIRTKTSEEEVLRIEGLIDYALDFSRGNFLYLKTIINYWRRHPDKVNAESIPESLKDIYETFSERFSHDEIRDIERFLEVLLASNSPRTLSEIDKILTFCQQDNSRQVGYKLREYFKYDIDEGPLEFHHPFLAEWLVKQTNGVNGITIRKSKGHQYINECLTYFRCKRQIMLNITDHQWRQ